MNIYEVAFVVEGYIRNADDPIGNVECNGTEPGRGVHYLTDGRAYYDVEAEDPVEAMNKGEELFYDEDIGELHILGCKLEHVSLGDKYWYEEDLRAMERERDR